MNNTNERYAASLGGKQASGLVPSAQDGCLNRQTQIQEWVGNLDNSNNRLNDASQQLIERLSGVSIHKGETPDGVKCPLAEPTLVPLAEKLRNICSDIDRVSRALEVATANLQL